MAELHETMYGKRFFEANIPAIAKALERIADALEKQNESEMVKIKKKEFICDDVEVSNFMITRKAYEGKIARILNTISNSTAEDLTDVITAIKNDEIKTTLYI